MSRGIKPKEGGLGDSLTVQFSFTVEAFISGGLVLRLLKTVREVRAPQLLLLLLQSGAETVVTAPAELRINSIGRGETASPHAFGNRIL